MKLTSGSATTLTNAAAADGIALAPGPMFHADRRGDGHFRLPLTLDAERVPDTIMRLNDLARRAVGEVPRDRSVDAFYPTVGAGPAATCSRGPDQER